MIHVLSVGGIVITSENDSEDDIVIAQKDLFITQDRLLRLQFIQQ